MKNITGYLRYILLKKGGSEIDDITHVLENDAPMPVYSVGDRIFIEVGSVGNSLTMHGTIAVIENVVKLVTFGLEHSLVIHVKNTVRVSLPTV